MEWDEACFRRKRGGRIAAKFVPQVRSDPGGKDLLPVIIDRPGAAEARADPAQQRIHVSKADLGCDVARVVEIDVLIDQLCLRLDAAAGEFEGIAALERGGGAL